MPLGFGRVYVQLEGGLDADAWLGGLNAGRSFVTTGPMLFVTLDGHAPGHRFEQTDPGPRDYRLAVAVESASLLDRIELVQNGEVVGTLVPGNRRTERGAYTSRVEAKVTIEGTSWVAVRCYETIEDCRERFAHSSPFHIDVPARPLRPRKFEVDYLMHRVQTQLDRGAPVLPGPALEEYRAALEAHHKVAEKAR